MIEGASDHHRAGECDDPPASLGRRAGGEPVAKPTPGQGLVSHKGRFPMAITKKVSLVAAVAAVVLAAGVAFASWTSGGGGQGSARAKTAVALSTVAVPASSAGLYPGADAKVTIRVVNDNDFAVRISGVSYGT